MMEIFKLRCLVVALIVLCLAGCQRDSGLKRPWEDMDRPVPAPPTVIPTETGIRVATYAGTRHEMILIPKGEFEMGADNGIRNEGPAHMVFVDAFYIDRTEVTNAQWNLYATVEHERLNFDPPEHPVVNVSWLQADAYCKWLGGRLPTEAEWEKAARGTDGRVYPWGNDAESNRANYFDSGDPFDNGTVPADYFGDEGRDGRSPYGVLGLAGNVWEWILDEYDGAYYQRSPEVNPANYELKTHYLHLERVIRGGSWFSSSFLIRTTVRASRKADLQTDTVGFRCVVGKSFE